ncbi:chaoptin isoform X2 [Dendroctonus ponderosae]|uniref:chaoptin isoform X2 n=1 Tax=Dendroctonus ponderosae TaxID=77166 RepID=UPI002035A4FC|nr:chaoptin isoform X2 [Dendroctonus ponderosae]
MEILQIIQFGYALAIGIFFFMVWVSMVESKEQEPVRDPPCIFNPLCSCSKSSPDLGIVTCRDVHLPRISEAVNMSKVFKLHLENNNLRTMEPYFLQSTGLYKIVISNNPLVTMPDEAFLGLERSLWELELSHCQLTKVPNRALRYLQKLRILDLTGNEINKISPENWRGLEGSLEILILADNSLAKLPLDAFGGLPMVETIDLRGNNLREIDPAIFRDGMGHLAHLLLGDNQLSAIPYQALQPLRTLKTLDLSYNHINKMSPVTDAGANININFQLNLDTFKLDYNRLSVLETTSFQYFNVLNKTFLDGNPLTTIEDNAFRQAKIRELYIRSCGLTNISPGSFGGLENYLEKLDLSGNNISLLPKDVFQRFQFIKELTLRDNMVTNWTPMETFTSFQFTLNNLDLSGAKNSPIKLQDLRRFRGLRTLTLSRLIQPHIASEDFLEYGVDLEELSITYANLQSIKSNAFKYVHGLKHIDLSDNNIGTIENNAFKDIGYSLEQLHLAHAFSSSVTSIPGDGIKVLNNLEYLDLSNNKFRIMEENSFHFLGKLRKLELQDNIIETIHKGTFQSDIHSNLEQIYLSFNTLKSISQHTFVHLPKLEQLHIDDNKLETLERRSFMNLERLKRLNLKGNKLATISYEAFQNLPELEHLDMSYNKIEKFDFNILDQVGTLAMFHLNVSHNVLNKLVLNMPSTFVNDIGSGGYHSNIQVLDMSFNNISMIAKKFFRPAEISLTNLYLSHNRIINATRDVFGNMPHLQWLDLSSNHIYEMDFDMFRNTKKLQVLDVSHNRITDIPNDIFRFLANLRMVDISNNRIRALPDNLFREEGLEKLDLSSNLLSKMPLNSLAIPAAQTLCELDLSWNLISSLSHGGLLERFKKLNYLDLSYNRLAQIDVGTFKGLPRLLYLDLSHNSQLTLEPNGGSFKGLEYSLLHLKIDNVSLSIVPIFPTPNLVTLSLASNSLPSMPPEMATNMTNLQTLNLNYNSLTIVPILTHSLFELRVLTMVANQITYLSNTSLLGVADHLEELDIRNFDLTILEAGAFCKMYSLRTLKMNLYTGFKTFNIPTIIQWNTGLRNLEIHVDKQSDSDLTKELAGDFPPKLQNITFSGRGLKRIGAGTLQGVKFPDLHICLRNTSIIRVPGELFKNIGSAKNLTVDVRDNKDLKSLMNPSTGPKPDLFKKTFLKDLKIMGNRWDCDCDLGWIEVWQRKHRQYICEDSPSIAPYFNHFGYICKHTRDDLRMSLCANKNNNSVVEVLKADIECGWSSGSKINGLNLVFTIWVGVVLRSLL